MSESDASPWLFLFGLVVFLGSGTLFVVDLVRGVDPWWSIVANATGAVVLIGWAALDTIRDPDSAVATVGGATGTALLLYGLYLSGAGVVITVTGLLRHDHLDIGVLYLGVAVTAVILGYLVFPSGTVLGEDDERETTTASGEVPSAPSSSSESDTEE
ncbi:hypothetical protein ACFQJ7_01075 [Halovenus rubra]|uniref:Uncharacterized protein n=2 Tax=Halovenus rubra TaxID=869890 RepID=A0ACC7E133_9EURY|nr:hypothetical protein [Halovenus rubra]